MKFQLPFYQSLDGPIDLPRTRTLITGTISIHQLVDNERIIKSHRRDIAYVVDYDYALQPVLACVYFF